MPDVEPVTRGEFDLLRQMVAATQTRIESIDTSGTRGVTGIQVQLTDLVKDVADLKADVNSKFNEVEGKFEKQRQERISNRRWLVGIGITGLGTMGTVIALLIQILQNIH